MKLYSKRHHDKKKIEIGSEDKRNGIKHEIEIDNNLDSVNISPISLLDKDEVI